MAVARADFFILAMPSALLKKAFQYGRFFYFTLCLTTLSNFSHAETRCPTSHIDARVTVSYVYDGDTVRLQSGDKIRFIGINTPEMARQQRPAEFLANDARQALIKLLSQHQYHLELRYGQQQRDRYGRLLAHAYTPDGVSISAYLLDKGFANLIAIPPNVHGLDCYAKAEKAAQQRGDGLWQRTNIHDSHKLPRHAQGFKLVRGKVLRITESRKNLWLNLQGGLALRIAKKDLHWFTQQDPRDFTGKTVIARGWISNKKGRQRMRVHHPYALELLNDK